MSRVAVLSDIHGNLEALDAVLADLELQTADRLVVLGDTVGYGPNPRECLERISAIAEVLLIGNHEADLIQPDPDMDVDQDLRDWTKAQLAGLPAWEAVERRVHEVGVDGAGSGVVEGMRLVHGSPAAPTTQYIWPAHPCQYLVFNWQIGERLREFLQEYDLRIGCCGHTHVPAVLTEYEAFPIFDPYEAAFEWNREKSFVSPQALFVVPRGGATLELPPDAKIVINPGSVGQPRDENPAASYALVDSSSVEFRRVEYDSTPTLEKLSAMPIDPETCDDLLERLRSAR